MEQSIAISETTIIGLMYHRFTFWKAYPPSKEPADADASEKFISKQMWACSTALHFVLRRNSELNMRFPPIYEYSARVRRYMREKNNSFPNYKVLTCAWRYMGERWHFKQKNNSARVITSGSQAFVGMMTPKNNSVLNYEIFHCHKHIQYHFLWRNFTKLK